MKIQVGVMGSAGGRLPRKIKRKAFELGGEIAKRGCVLVTGACPGLPYEAVKGCKRAGGITVGVSPALNLQEHIHQYCSPHLHFDAIIYTGDGLMGREVTGIRSCDIVILLGGRSGTLGEFAIAYDEGRLIGVLEESGGIADHVGDIVRMINKETGALLISDKLPERLLPKLIKAHEIRRRRPAPTRYRAG